MKYFLILILTNSLALAQTNPAIDSLVAKGKSLIGKADNRSLKYSYKAFNLSSKENYYWGKMNAAKWLAEVYYYKNNMDSAMKYDDLALSLSRQENDLPEIGNTLVAKAQKIAEVGRKEEALNLFREARSIMEARKDTSSLIDLLLRVGFINNLLDRTDAAMAVLTKASKFSIARNDLLSHAHALDYMAIVQKKIGNFDKAIALDEEALPLFRESKDAYALVSVLNNLGVLYKDTKQYRKALAMYQEAETVAEPLESNRISAILADNKGILLNLMRRYPEAEAELRRSIDLATQVSYMESLADARINLARSLHKQGRSAEARQQIVHGLDLARQIKALEKQKEGHFIAREIFAEQGDLATALFHADALLVVKDSIYTLEKTKQINQLQTQYETAKKDAEIEILNKNAELDRNRRIALVVILVLLALTAAAWIYSLAVKRKKLLAENALVRQQRMNAEQERLHVEQELEFKHKELTTKVLQLARKNEFLNSLEEQVAVLKNSMEDTVRQTSRRIIRLIKSDIAEDKQWEQFGEEFRSLHKGYMEALTEKHGNLTTNEIRLISLLMMNLSSKDIAATLRISNESILTARYRLRKKLGLDTEQDLQGYLISFM
ncbi:tetratricopeptide repeat protein [Salmonirosea aquatica]|uniref:Tetratricopeptide repeat protein n=1 Tax=Salmonirosea aquatica TaxID=2654236 RepID=A0A7C9BGQ5_9BACT|nr:tetratricopeptide repeat protein [Cytophagaceae bacterium SJW1-29]